MRIDYSSYESAIKQLEKSLAYFNSDMARQDADIREQFRAACIQAFEYTYELCVKILRRQLEPKICNRIWNSTKNFFIFHLRYIAK